MLKIEDLTVGTVAGLIAAGVFVIHFMIPTLFPLILVGVLGNENNAATWSVTGRALHSSHWPSVLRTDSAGMQGVRGSVRFISVFQLIVVLLITVASIVTPLGLYETILPQHDLTEEPFSYVKDDTTMGIGTLPRNNDFGFSRVCAGILPQVCPWSETKISKGSKQPLTEGYDRRIPRNITEIYTAGLSKLDKTVSSVFDIQWRTYKKVVQSRTMKADQQYLVGDYRHISQMVLNDAWQAITGLLVNTKTGGIGFRNHTTPPFLPFGSIWSEDLLFIEPETECVDLNVTMDFNIRYSEDDSAAFNDIENLVITDHGGFANINKQIPDYEKDKAWTNPNLRDRAYFAAWFNNVNTMFYLNISNPKTKTLARFHYLNSTVGAGFPITNDKSNKFQTRYDQVMLQGVYGGFLNLNDVFGNSSTSKTRNPFNITGSDFERIPIACSGSDNTDYANISNVAVSCGMMYGAARRKDGSASLFFDPGSEWTVPLYSCASASKASIKKVQFRYNGTDGLQSLDIVDLQPKVYQKDDDKPLWAVENLGMQLEVVNPIWGITLPEHENHPNISTARQEHLYLPGIAPMDFTGSKFEGSLTQPLQNLAGVDFYQRIMALAYEMDGVSTDTSGLPDYTGKFNMAMYNRWQELSRNAITAAKIVNHIWTDISANAVVGTRSQLGSPELRNLAKREVAATTAQVPITVYTRRVHFRIYYGIPAFLVIALSAIVVLAALVFILIGRASPSRMRKYLDLTSTGRILTTFLYTNDCTPTASRADWIRAVGQKRIDLGGLYPRGIDATIGQPLNSGFASAGFPNSPVGPVAIGKWDEAGISMNNLSSPQQYSPVGHTGGGGGGAASSYYGQVPQETYTYVAHDEGRLDPPGGAGYTEFRTGSVSPIDPKIR